MAPLSPSRARAAAIVGLLQVASPLGEVVLAASEAGLCGLWFSGQKHFPALPALPLASPLPILRQAGRQLAEYLAGARRDFELPLDLSAGTDFQQRVWRALRAVPFGATTSYGALAAAIGQPRAAHAVGAAVGRNPISVVVPCHRALGADGALTGYAGGLERKIELLRIEGHHDLFG